MATRHSAARKFRCERVDRHVLWLLKLWLKAPVEELMAREGDD